MCSIDIIKSSINLYFKLKNDNILGKKRIKYIETTFNIHIDTSYNWINKYFDLNILLILILLKIILNIIIKKLLLKLKILLLVLLIIITILTLKKLKTPLRKNLTLHYLNLLFILYCIKIILHSKILLLKMHLLKITNQMILK